MKKIPVIIIFIISAFLLTSCRTAPVRTVSTTYYTPPTVDYDLRLAPGAMSGQNLFHVVAPGETVWRLGKMYNVKPEDIMRANNLNTPQELEIGQRIVIPGAGTQVPRPVITLYPSSKWKYIIIHHSATDEGSAIDINKAHNVRGFKGLGYHFVIDNGSGGKSEGQIEMSPRWIKQQDGAHCIASGMNHRGIGICLVGNFSQDALSDRQLDSLVYLVEKLKEYYKISDRNIMGHGQVYGAHTECPGKLFPWRKFFQKLNTAR